MWLALGLAPLWVASDWPVHDIGEEYLFSVHMTQHMLLTFVVPPLFLLATPEWLARLVLGRGRVKRVFDFLARPIPAALAVQRLPAVHPLARRRQHVGRQRGRCTTSCTRRWWSTAFLMWMPVCGPLPELRISYPAQMLYLFVISIVPTVPAGWLTFAEGAVYSAYDMPDRLWGLTITDDQQMAGVIMKLVGGGFLWLVITIRFFQWATKFSDTDKAVDQAGPPTTSRGPTSRREFDKHPAAQEPHPAPHRGDPPTD